MATAQRKNKDQRLHQAKQPDDASGFANLSSKCATEDNTAAFIELVHLLARQAARDWISSEHPHLQEPSDDS